MDNAVQTPLGLRLVQNGIITGTTDGLLNPSGTTTRAQVAVILYRLGT